MRRPLAVLVLLTLLAVAAPASAAVLISLPRPKHIACTDSSGGVADINLKIDGQTAHGEYALPAKKPTGLVVFAHGYGHTSKSWEDHMKSAARELGVIAVAMDYRGAAIEPDANGDGLPESHGWNVVTGAQDSIAVARMFSKACKTDKIVLLGVSMGGNASGLAVAEVGANSITDAKGKPLFDYWIDVEGAVNVTETYFEASALAPANAFAAQAKADIEAEAGGTYDEVPEVYQHMTVMNRLDDIAASGIKGVVVIHGLDDGLVPYNQGREITEGLAANSIPVDMFTIGRKSPESDNDTSLTGYVGGQVQDDYRSPLSGHASEASNTHIVMVTAFSQMAAIFGGTVPGPYNDYFVDGEAGTFPSL